MADTSTDNFIMVLKSAELLTSFTNTRANGVLRTQPNKNLLSTAVVTTANTTTNFKISRTYRTFRPTGESNSK